MIAFEGSVVGNIFSPQLDENDHEADDDMPIPLDYSHYRFVYFDENDDAVNMDTPEMPVLTQHEIIMIRRVLFLLTEQFNDN